MESHYQNISNFDTQIVEQAKIRDIARGIVDAATPIIDDVDNLNARTAAIRSSITALMPSLQDLKAHLNSLHVQVDEMVEAFSTITESKHFDMSTDRYVQILVGLATSTVKLDACCRNPAECLINQITQISIPGLRLGRASASSSKQTATEDAAAAWKEWREALALPSPCALPSVDGLSHQHNLPGVLSRFEEQKQEVARAEQTGVDKIYEP